ncbi:hypothetical protein B0H63DRAFT_289968 [Podospora didyma]|uniref:Uncharacterized protein n=1 Tax=Podospora didyma TaxID=330526 RepID=A0AAE0K9T7_9PEZI|nr:hypothetical protein B0H63DRAFT_289968 [Podospora didyma]
MWLALERGPKGREKMKKSTTASWIWNGTISMSRFGMEGRLDCGVTESIDVMLWLTTTLTTTLALALSSSASRTQKVLYDADANTFNCDLPPVLNPGTADGLPAARDIFSDEKALHKQVERLGTLVRVPPISYDDAGEPGCFIRYMKHWHICIRPCEYTPWVW